MALTVLLTALSTQARAANPASTLGVYAGGGNTAAVSSFESRLGRTLAQVHDYQPKDRWESLSDISWPLGQWNAGDHAHHVVYSIPMLPDSGGTLAEGASGAFNSHFRTLALKLVAGGDGGATLRLGWEFNGDWFRWSIAAPNGSADYAAFWRQIVITMRSVPGAAFKFDWCPSNGSSHSGGKQLDAASAYPGDAYVDYIGMDIYDQSWSSQRADQSARWNEYLTQKDGLDWQRDFAAAHGKQMSFPEWGVGHRVDGYGGGDSPYFIERMYEWIRTNNVAYHNYFEFADTVLDAALFGGKSPNASKRFIELFGPSSTGGPIDAGAGTAGNSGTLPQDAHRQATSRAARLTASKPRIKAAKLVTRGTIVRAARGVVRLELVYKFNGHKVTRTFSAKIANGRWNLRAALSPRVRKEIARRSGSVTSNVRYTGYSPASIGGQTKFFKVLDAR